MIRLMGTYQSYHTEQLDLLLGPTSLQFLHGHAFALEYHVLVFLVLEAVQVALSGQLVVGCLPLYRTVSPLDRFVVRFACSEGDLVAGLLPALFLGETARVYSLEDHCIGQWGSVVVFSAVMKDWLRALNKGNRLITGIL